MSATIVCTCNQCKQNIEFEAEHAGTTVPCPHCGVDTVLFSPALKDQVLKQQVSDHYKRKEPETALRIAYLKPCYACGETVSKEAARCPHCGHPLKDAASWGLIFTIVFRTSVWLLLISAVLGFILACLAGFIKAASR
jgi:DNA-directed RNA polymerase subunit RPC12/RpoP